MEAVTRLLSENTVSVKKKAGHIKEKKGLWSLVRRVEDYLHKWRTTGTITKWTVSARGGQQLNLKGDALRL